MLSFRKLNELRVTLRRFCTLTPYDIRPGMIIFHDGMIHICLYQMVPGRYVEILKSGASSNKKLKGMYKVELLDLFTNQHLKEYFSFGQIEKFDST